MSTVPSHLHQFQSQSTSKHNYACLFTEIEIDVGVEGHTDFTTSNDFELHICEYMYMHICMHIHTYIYIGPKFIMIRKTFSLIYEIPRIGL